MQGEQRASFVSQKIQFMHRGVVDNLKKKEFEKAKVWLEACESVNKLQMTDFKFEQIHSWWLKLMQLCPWMFDEATYAERLKTTQFLCYKKILKDKGEAEGDKFLAANKLNRDEMIDETPNQFLQPKPL